MTLIAEYPLEQTTWPALAQAVRECLVLHMQRHVEAGAPARLHLVVSLRLLPEAPQQAFTPLLDWLALQCPRIEITASRHARHKLCIG